MAKMNYQNSSSVEFIVEDIDVGPAYTKDTPISQIKLALDESYARQGYPAVRKFSKTYNIF